MPQRPGSAGQHRCQMRGFSDNRGRQVNEPGQIDVYAGDSSKAELTKSFQVTG